MDWNIRLKNLMKSKGVNIEQLKTKIELNGHSLSRNSIGNILNGKNSPKIETLQIIVRALEVDFWKVFSDSKTGDEYINGYIETKDQIYRIKSRKDLKDFIELSEKKSNNTKSKQILESSKQKSFYDGMQSYATRAGAHKKSIKLKKHIFKKYNVTVCSMQEFQEIPNDLSKDIKLWAFRTKEDVQLAKSMLKEQFNFKFNE